MKKLWKRTVSLALTAAMLSAMCLTSSAAFQYPSAYWKLHDAWAVAKSEQNQNDILTLAQKTFDLLTKQEICADICYNLEPKCALASWVSEMQGDLDGAITWAQRQLVFAEWLDKNVHSYKDTLLNGNARLEYLRAAAEPKIYALTDQPGLAFPGTAASAEGTWYGSTVDGSDTSPYTALMYVNFGERYGAKYWIDYYKNTNPDFKKAVTKGGIIEFAWNFTPESTAGMEAVLSADRYIDTTLKTLGGLKATVLLRVGAEMNNWADSDPATFIQAFRKIADAARKYDNIELVFSPDNISNRNHSFEEYWPGDEYVDWIGVSTYHNTNYTGQTPYYNVASEVYGVDAYYGQGLYDSDPLVILRPLVRFAQTHGKPMMISECGFSYRNPATGADQTSFAADQMNKFYSYVNMIYPQVKAVFYFDQDVTGSYKLKGNSVISATYQNAIEENGGYRNEQDAETMNWHLMRNAEVKGSVKLATYAPFPGQNPTTVTYYLDGKAVATRTEAPYYYELDTTKLSAGEHTFWASAASGKFSRTTELYRFTLEDQSAPAGLPMDTAGWAKDLILDAEAKGLITSRSRMDFTTRITRLQFAELAVNLIEKLTGQTVPASDKVFSDTTDIIARKAVTAGVTSGTGDGTTFTPNGLIDRQQICIMLNAVVKYVDGVKGTNTLTNPDKTLNPAFTDAGDIQGWALPFVVTITNNGLMSGKTGTAGLRVAPADNTTIAEAIVLIRALHDKF